MSLLASDRPSPNPRLQRTPLRAPLSRKPLARFGVVALLLVARPFQTSALGAEDWPPPAPHEAKHPVLVRKVEATPQPLRDPLILKGPLILEFVVEANSRVGPVRVTSSTHPVVDRAWVEAVKQWRYRPATVNGKPIRFIVTTVINGHPENWPRKRGANGEAG